ncbi:MAG: TetR family transcriptional regulator C-terminal domain-containing protein [Nonlabens sp.]
MATVKKTTKKPVKKQKEITRGDLITLYMDYVLEHEKAPRSVYKFAKEYGMTEQDFYSFYGSFTSLRRDIWNTFFTMTMDVMHKSEEFEHMSNREKMLTFFYTYFEILTLNRSYVLFALDNNRNMMDNMDQLKGLRRHVKDFARDLIMERNEEKSSIILEKSEKVYSEGAWVQMVFLLKFWLNDDSAGFEKTDVAIEKSVNTIFDVFDNSPLESVLDFGKFIWKERSY